MKAPSSTKIPDIEWGGPLVAWSLTDDDLLQLAIRHVKEVGGRTADFLVEVATVLEALLDERDKWQLEFGNVSIDSSGNGQAHDARVIDRPIH